MKRSKRYQEARKSIADTKTYALKDALAVAKSTATTKFDSSVELHVKLGIDPKNVEERVRGSCILPHGTGKALRIAAFAEGADADAAVKAGAHPVGGDELIAKIAANKNCDFDIALATPPMMKKLSKIAKILGQKGLMPNPKNETITSNLHKAIKELASGKVAYRNDDSGNVHQMIGKASWEEGRLQENAAAFLSSIRRSRPSSAKGTFIRSVVLKTTMGPAIRVAA